MPRTLKMNPTSPKLQPTGSGLFLGRSYYFWALTLGFWIKLNIVLFTYKPYTATKFYFPLLLLVVLWKAKEVGLKRLWTDRDLAAASLFLLTFAVPLGYLWNPHSWAVYRQWGLSMLSFYLLFAGALLLDLRERRRLVEMIAYFCLIGLGYLLLQYLLGWSYEPGHFRRANPFPRPYGILDDPAHSAGIYLTGLALSLVLPLTAPRLRWMWAMVPLYLYALWVSRTLGSYLGLAGSLMALVGLAPFWSLDLKGNRLGRLVFGLWLFLFLAFLAASVAYHKDYRGMKTQMASSSKAISMELRAALAFTALDIFEAHPLVGLGTANDHYPPNQKAWAASRALEVRFLAQHMTPLAMLVGSGLVGLLAFLWLLYRTCLAYGRAWKGAASRAERAKVWILLAWFFGLQILSLTLLMLYSISFWIFLLLPHLLSNPPQEPAPHPGLF
ncbi:MAG: O-antigen ligase family protein [bacterium]|nr:O-antigen ligase family protein [bacterium]